MRIRTFQWDDLPAVAEVINEFFTGYGRPPMHSMTAQQLESTWRLPYNHPDRDCFVAEMESGKLIGYTIADLLDDPHRANGVYRVLPGHPDIAKQLIASTHEHFQRMAAQRGVTDESITIEWTIPSEAKDAAALLEQIGCTCVRTFYTMSIDLPAEPITPEPLPDGFARRPFVPAMVESVYTAYEEIFRDHWGGPNSTLDEWRMDIEQPSFDPSLWWIIEENAAENPPIAGLLTARRLNDHVGWVDLLGVRRAWRKRGLASVLLSQAFAEFQRRGCERVDLGVDSDSPTNAVSLYQRAGMHIRQRTLYYDKVLTP